MTDLWAGLLPLFRGKHVRTYTSGHRYYEIPPGSGTRYWSVTTIEGQLKIDALPYAASRDSTEWAIPNWDALTPLVKADPQKAAKTLTNAYRDIWNYKAKLGTAVHKAAETIIDAINKGQPAKLTGYPEDQQPRIDGFAKWITHFNPTFGPCEVTGYNATYSYAGTFDLFATIAGRNILIDIKTGGRRLYGSIALQLAAYRNFEHILGPNDEPVPMPHVDGVAGLHLPHPDYGNPDGYSFHPIHYSPEVFETFIALRRVWTWNRTEDDMVGHALKPEHAQ